MLQVEQAVKGRTPSLSYPRPGLCSGRAVSSAGRYLRGWFSQFLTPAPSHFSLHPLSPGWFFCRTQPGWYGSPGLLSCSSLLFGYICCCHRPKAALPRSPSITSGCLSATGSGLCSCHLEKHKEPLFFLPTGGTRPRFPGAWPEPRCAWGAEQWGKICLRCLAPAPQAAGDE